MKLDVLVLRYLNKDDFRTLTAIEQGMKNHEMVPTALIITIAKLKRGGVKDALKTIHKLKLVWHDTKRCEKNEFAIFLRDILSSVQLLARLLLIFK